MQTQRPPKNPTDRWAWIIYQLALRGQNLSDVARSLGVTRFAVYRARYEPRRRVEQAVAERLGLKPCQLWPERYPDCVSECTHLNPEAEAVQ